MATATNYEFKGMSINDYTGPAIDRYIDEHRPPGGFLSAVISNDLQGAVAHADEWNIHNIPAIVAYFYNNAPSICWGSKERMEAWLETTERD